ncbi:MAG: hypothetical protein ACREBH_01880 [Candidatus Micrarchaeaceae archaeon]
MASKTAKFLGVVAIAAATGFGVHEYDQASNFQKMATTAAQTLEWERSRISPAEKYSGRTIEHLRRTHVEERERPNYQHTVPEQHMASKRQAPPQTEWKEFTQPAVQQNTVLDPPPQYATARQPAYPVYNTPYSPYTYGASSPYTVTANPICLQLSSDPSSCYNIMPNYPNYGYGYGGYGQYGYRGYPGYGGGYYSRPNYGERDYQPRGGHYSRPNYGERNYQPRGGGHPGQRSGGSMRRFRR